MRRYWLTHYERVLEDYVDELLHAIRERDEHLIRANGYAPGSPRQLDENMKHRETFVFHAKTRAEILEDYEAHRPEYRKMFRASENSLLFCLKGQKFPAFTLTTSDIRTMEKRTCLKGKIEDSPSMKASNTHFEVEGFDRPLPKELFKNIEPFNKPELILPI